MTISTLIDKQDAFEIVRDLIFNILTTEVLSQMAIASGTPGKDPNDWSLKIFSERSNPWEEFLNDPPEGEERSPIVNIWYDNSAFDGQASNISERQGTTAIYNIDMYGYGKSAEDGTGHKAGDKMAAFEVQRAIRLVRNILMAAEYTYLGVTAPKGTSRPIWQRWVQSINTFQPQLDSRPVQQIVGARMAFRVKFNEFSPQIEPETLELLSATVKRLSDDADLIRAEYDYS
jgi:hypothetical protein